MKIYYVILFVVCVFSFLLGVAYIPDSEREELPAYEQSCRFMMLTPELKGMDYIVYSAFSRWQYKVNALLCDVMASSPFIVTKGQAQRADLFEFSYLIMERDRRKYGDEVFFDFDTMECIMRYEEFCQQHGKGTSRGGEFNSEAIEYAAEACFVKSKHEMPEKMKNALKKLGRL